MAGHAERNAVYDDDAFDDDSFLSAVANIEAQHVERMSNVLSYDGTKVGGEQTPGANFGSNVLDSREKKSGIWEKQNAYGGKDQPLSGTKRRRAEEDSRVWPGHTFGQDTQPGVGVERHAEAQPEGEYMAALRGSNSELWKSTAAGRGGLAGSSNRGSAGYSNRGPEPGNAASGGNFRGGVSGTCFKCGMEGHWAKDCVNAQAVGNENAQFGREGQAAAPERLCPCGAGACIVLTAHTEKNAGRTFYKCPRRKEEGQCTYFEWCDTVGQSMPAERGNAQPFSQQPHMQSLSQHPQSLPPLQCRCGGGPCVILTAKTEKNMGRQFYRCPSQKGQECGFFQWCDEVGKTGPGSNPSTPTKPSRYPGNVASPASPTGTCFKCGQPGHWSRDCPNQHPQNVSSFGGRSYPSRGGTESRNMGNCYKCGGQSHWPSSCPNAGAPAGQSSSKFGGGSTPRGSCYKCGSPDHWANRCPTTPGGHR